MEETYRELITSLRRLALLGSSNSLLSWERETFMPEGGTQLRSEQVSLLAGVQHQWATAPRLGELLNELAEADLGPDDGPMSVNVRQAKRDYDLATKLPQRLVEDLSRVTTLAQGAWHRAKLANDFSAFEPWLDQVLTLKREEADCLRAGADSPLYDSLLDQYEPGMTTEQLKATFGPLREKLVPLVAAIADATDKPEANILNRQFPIDQQKEFSRKAAAAIGFDLNSGRIDESAHPFCSGIGPGDCRLTTRYDENFFNMAFFGTLHESGHGIYEQGLDPESFGLGMGQSVSLGIHESQSRLWENLVGRSHAFWQNFYPEAQERFSAFHDVPLETFYRSINLVEPSWIRVEADEVTYNLHIMLRFELEQRLVAGELKVADLPEAWNSLFHDYFGITPPDDAHGCLQDVHWSAGLFGYFPTYALGNIYASQFYEAAERDLGDLNELFGRGEFAPLKDWLNTNIHRRGQQYLAADLVKVVTGNEFNADPLLQYLNRKFGDVYRLSN